MSRQQIMTSSPFFRFIVDLEQSGTQIPDTWSMTLIFSLIAIFHLKKCENRTKKSLPSSHTYSFEEKYCFCQKVMILAKKY